VGCEAHRLFTEIGATGRAEAIAAQLTPPSGISSAY